jgi:predicted transcriptional regulator
MGKGYVVSTMPGIADGNEEKIHINEVRDTMSCAGRIAAMPAASLVSVDESGVTL